MTVIDSPGAVTPPRTMFRRGARILRHGVATHPRPFAVALLGAVLYGTMAVGGAAALGVVTDRVVVPAYDHGVRGGRVAAAVAGLLGVAALRATGVVLRRYFGNATTRRMQATWLRRIADTYLRAPLAYFGRHPTGELLAHADADVERAVNVIQPLPLSLGVVVLVLAAAVSLAVVDPPLLLVGLALFPAVGFVNSRYTARIEEPAALSQARTGVVSGLAHESFDGAVVVKTLGLEGIQSRRLEEAATDLRSARLRVGRLRATYEPAIDALTGLGTVALVAIGAWRTSTGALTTGELVLAVTLFGVLAFPVRVVGFLLREMPRAVVAADRLEAVVAEPAAPAPPPGRAEPLPPGPLAVEVAGLRFTPPGSDEPVLDGLDLSLRPGEVVALVGATAAGKTTLCHLLADLHRPEAGTIRLGGVDLVRAGPEAVHRAVAVAFQEPFLFAGTVRENVVLDRDVSDDELAWALAVARADEFVPALAGGLDQVVGERGVTLSGGQRQRLALARALLRRPGLLLLDDATSAVDPVIEQEVLDRLRDELRATTVLVAHRVASIALADRVLYLDGGRIAASGRHEELVARVPGYAALALAYERRAP
jgi:ATP-binding cassette, subfamily B, bacterial